MRLVWLRGPVGAGKTVVGLALARRLPGGVFQDGDDVSVPDDLPPRRRWRLRLRGLLRQATRNAGRPGILVVAYPLDLSEVALVRRLLARCRIPCVIATVRVSLSRNLVPSGPRHLSEAERWRIREMHAQGHARSQGTLRLFNLAASPMVTAERCARLTASRLHGTDRCRDMRAR